MKTETSVAADRDRRTQIYFAVWLGTEDTWSRLYTTARTEAEAKHFVGVCEQFGRNAYYTTEQGPIVPLGGKDEQRH